MKAEDVRERLKNRVINWARAYASWGTEDCDDEVQSDHAELVKSLDLLDNFDKAMEAYYEGSLQTFDEVGADAIERMTKR